MSWLHRTAVALVVASVWTYRLARRHAHSARQAVTAAAIAAVLISTLSAFSSPPARATAPVPPRVSQTAPPPAAQAPEHKTHHQKPHAHHRKAHHKHHHPWVASEHMSGMKLWTWLAFDALKDHGYKASQLDPGAANIIAFHESGYDYRSVNRWDSNAAIGTPSMGLMQCIRPTFDAWSIPGHRNILNPVDSIIASARYGIDRYGSMKHIPGVQSVRAGGPYLPY